MIRLPKLRIDTDRQAKRWLVLAGAVCASIFLATVPFPRVDNHLIGSDGMSYYAITRSIVLDRDLDLTNDYKLLPVTTGLTSRGLQSTPFAIGTPILWIPFFLLAHLISLLLVACGLAVPLNGISYIYEVSVCLGTIAYATIGFILAYHIARKALQGSIPYSFWGVIGMWWATPAIYYVIAEPSMSHGLTIFTVALFLLIWYPPSPHREMRTWMSLGVATGLVALTRWQDGIIALVPLTELCCWLLQRKLDTVRALSCLSVFGVACILVFLPQVLMWNTLYGEYLTVPQGRDFLDWGNTHVMSTLFSTRHGLISWHPIFLLALLGALPLWRKSRVIAAVVACMFVGELYINSATWQWWAGDSFGNRRFVSLIPLLIVPLIALLTRMKRVWVMAALVTLIGWNGLSLLQYRLGFVSMGKALTIREMTIGRLLVPLQLVRKVLG